MLPDLLSLSDAELFAKVVECASDAGWTKMIGDSDIVISARTGQGMAALRQ